MLAFSFYLWTNPRLFLGNLLGKDGQPLVPVILVPPSPTNNLKPREAAKKKKKNNIGCVITSKDKELAVKDFFFYL